jgi:DNA polymerase III delta subunit
MANKILLKTKDDFQVDSYLYKIEKENPGYSCRKYYNAEELMERITGSSLFEDDKEISVLMDLNSDGVKLLGNCNQEITEDPIILIQRKSISKTKAYTNLTVDFEVTKLEPLSTKECVIWVGNTLKGRKIRHSKAVPEIIVNAVGNNQYALLNEINKLSMLVKETFLDQKNIVTYLASSESSDYFSFIDHLTHLRFSETMKEFEKVDPNTYAKFIGFITSQLEKFYKICVYRSKGYSLEDVSDLVGIPGFIIKTKIYTAFSFLPKVKLLKALDIFLELSEKLRSSKLDKKLIFESYLLKIFNI